MNTNHADTANFELWFYGTAEYKNCSRNSAEYKAALAAWVNQQERMNKLAEDTYQDRKRADALQNWQERAKKLGFENIGNVFTRATASKNEREHFEAKIYSYEAKIKELDKWRMAVIEGLVTNCIYDGPHNEDPDKAVVDLIKCEIEMALDTAISGAAINLIDSWFKRLDNINLGVALTINFDQNLGFSFSFEDGPGIIEHSQDYYPSAIEAIKAAEKLANSGEW